MKSSIHIAVFASGAGTNARNLVKYFKHVENVQVSLLLSNNPDSGIPQIASSEDIPFFMFNREQFYHSDKVIQVLHAHNIQLIVLAGFLWLIPAKLIEIYPNRIINIHPALLPKYGGKGMYGMRVHQAVKEHQEKQTGITIHLVNEEYDKGRVLFQQTIDVLKDDSPEDIAAKVHALEYAHFPVVVERYIHQEFAL